MKLKVMILLVVCLVLTGCSINQKEENKNQETVQVNEEIRILIAYFTWADNTQVDRPDQVDVDASTSASVLSPGNTGLMASIIEENVGGDLFSIVVKDKYSSDYDLCLERASEELSNQERPALRVQVDNMDEYDVVFIGYPNWWGTCPMAVFSFLESYDFSNKTVIPFCAHGTGGIGKSLQDIESILEDSQIMEMFDVSREEVKNCQDDLEQWLKSIGMMDKN